MSNINHDSVPSDNDVAGSARKLTLAETVEPIGPRVVIRKDENRRVTSGGIALPDKTEIPVITGRIVAVSEQVRRDTDLPIREFDKVLFNPKTAIPVDFENDKLFVVHVDDLVAVFRRSRASRDGDA